MFEDDIIEKIDKDDDGDDDKESINDTTKEIVISCIILSVGIGVLAS